MNVTSVLEPDVEEALELASFGAAPNVAVIGASGGIGGALADQVSACRAVSKIVRLSRSAPASQADPVWLHIDLEDENSIADAASELKCLADAWHLVIVATGVLHDENRLQPEKTWRALSAPAMERAFVHYRARVPRGEQNRDLSGPPESRWNRKIRRCLGCVTRPKTWLL
jgi:NAD(P)-dependent dehydrogenase (short-subunit alcohol dehydrogenase family)